MEIAPYVIITPAHNEEGTLSRTIDSVVCQTVLPLRWVVVNDRSTDCTDEIVRSYATKCPWMYYVHKTEHSGPYFSSQIASFNYGFRCLSDVKYDYIGKLDADILLPPDYYERILERFQANPNLGIAGGEVVDRYDNQEYRHHVSPTSVSGGIHMLRRVCFEDIGGFLERREGGYDSVAEITARIKGWETRTFPELVVYHLKPLNLAAGNAFKRKWQMGRRDYFLGNHPLFEIGKCLFRSFEKPFLLGSILRMTAYTFLWCRRTEIGVPAEVRNYLRKEQLSRLLNIFHKKS